MALAIVHEFNNQFEKNTLNMQATPNQSSPKRRARTG